MSIQRTPNSIYLSLKNMFTRTQTLNRQKTKKKKEERTNKEKIHHVTSIVQLLRIHALSMIIALST